MALRKLSDISSIPEAVYNFIGLFPVEIS